MKSSFTNFMFIAAIILNDPTIISEIIKKKDLFLFCLLLRENMFKFQTCQSILYLLDLTVPAHDKSILVQCQLKTKWQGYILSNEETLYSDCMHILGFSIFINLLSEKYFLQQFFLSIAILFHAVKIDILLIPLDQFVQRQCL